jgi:hypothetical protein
VGRITAPRRRSTASSSEISWARHTDNASHVIAQRAEKSQLFHLFVEDDQLNVYAGEFEVRPPLQDRMDAD